MSPVPKFESSVTVSRDTEIVLRVDFLPGSGLRRVADGVFMSMSEKDTDAGYKLLLKHYFMAGDTVRYRWKVGFDVKGELAEITWLRRCLLRGQCRNCTDPAHHCAYDLNCAQSICNGSLLEFLGLPEQVWSHSSVEDLVDF